MSTANVFFLFQATYSSQRHAEALSGKWSRTSVQTGITFILLKLQRTEYETAMKLEDDKIGSDNYLLYEINFVCK